MNFQERLKSVKYILNDCPYKTQKKAIVKFFKKTKNNVKKDILLRLFIIDSCYSTNMNKRLFGFKELVDLILKIEPQLNNIKKDIDIIKFVKRNEKLLFNSHIGINRLGEVRGHAFSLISKYIYFRTEFNFPIYDRLVFDGLREEKLINLPQNPSLDYFEILIKIKNKYKISFDNLDKYFWVCGKIRKGSLSLLISDSESYNDCLVKLHLLPKEKKVKSAEFNNVLSKKLTSKKVRFNNPKLKEIQKIAKSIKRGEIVFKDLCQKK